MAGADFDKYVDEYRDIINRVASISGEQFEFFIQLRLGLMQERVVRSGAGYGPLSILDFGCGIGATENYLREVFPDAFIYAVDSSEESVHSARRRGLDGVTFVHECGSVLPFPDDHFDLVYSNGTYHHLEPQQHRNFLQEMFRVSKPGGDLFIFENNPRNPLMMMAMRNNPFDAGATALSPRYLSKLTKESGFHCKEIGYYFFFPRILRALRGAEKWLRRIPLGAQYFLWAQKP